MQWPRGSVMWGSFYTAFVLAALLVTHHGATAHHLGRQALDRAQLFEQVDCTHGGAFHFDGDAGAERTLDAQSVHRRQFLDREEPLQEVAETDGLLLHGRTRLHAGCPAVNLSP